MPASGRSIGNFINQYGYWADQEHVIKRALKRYALPIGAVGVVGTYARDLYKTKDPIQRREVAIKDGLVLGATTIGTLAAAYFVMFKTHNRDVASFETIMKAQLEAFSKVTQHYTPATRAAIEDLIRTPHKKPGDYKTLLSRIAEGKTADGKAIPISEVLPLDIENPEVSASIIDKLFPQFSKKADASSGIMKYSKEWLDEIAGAMKFFITGGISVASGIAGGWLGNKILHESPEKNVDMYKEGIFQFIANIALCAVGASIGLGVHNMMKGAEDILAHDFPKLAEKRPGLNQTARKMSQFAERNKVGKFGIIMAGLSLGIFGGSVAANALGLRFVDPFFERQKAKREGRPFPAYNQPDPNKKRRVEFLDIILHLDDLPTALAIAGVQLMEPFIPLFFAISAYRAGHGYRNDHSHGRHKERHLHPLPENFPTQPTLLINQPTTAPNNNILPLRGGNEAFNPFRMRVSTPI